MIEKITKILNEIREESGKEGIYNVTADMSLRRDFEFDSFDLALLTAKIEDEFDIDIFQNGVIDKISEILSILEEK